MHKQANSVECKPGSFSLNNRNSNNETLKRANSSHHSSNSSVSAESHNDKTKHPNKKNESTQLLNVNIVNEEISNIASSSLSVSSGKKLGVPASTIRRKSVNFINSLKNTTLSASKILSLGVSSSRSNSPAATFQINPVDAVNQVNQEAKKLPIDLEAHIIVNNNKSQKGGHSNVVSSRLRNVKKRISERISKSALKPKEDEDEEEEDEVTYDYDSDDDEDEDEDDDYTVDCQNNNEDSSDDEEDETTEDASNNTTSKELNKSSNLNSSLLYEDEEEDNENLNSVHCDLDEAYFYDVSKTKPAKFTSNLIKAKTQQASQTLKAPKPICQPLTSLNEAKNVESSSLASKIDLKNKINTSFKSFNQSRENSVENAEGVKLLETIVESKRASISSNLNQNNFLSVQPALKTNLISSSNNNSMPVIKTILSTSNKSSSNVNLSVSNGNGGSSNNGTGGSRQSVSFSDNMAPLKANETRYHRALSFNHANDDETTPMLLLSKSVDDPARLEYEKQVSLISAPTAVTTSQSVSDYDLSYLNKSEEVNDLAGKNFLSPLDVTLNSSFISSNTNYSASFVSRPSQSVAPVAIRVLHKSMTKGSKAMRVMGNNTTVLTGNGPLKASFSSGALSIKSGRSTLSRNSAGKKQQQKRLFFKNGNINISRCNIDKRRRRYLTDIFTTLIDLKWRYNILVFAMGFFFSWTFFAITWYLISLVHGDLDNKDKNHTACISGISSFAGAILFSIETQQTIGYGVRFTTEQCPEAIFVMMVQSSFGVMIQSFMVGVVFAKLSRPKKRSETLMFSKNAVISLRDGRLCLICRVGDMRKSHIVEAHVRMYLIKKRVTLEGEIMPLHMYDLNVGWDKGTDRLFLVWPLTIEHYIDENSPFWTIGAEDLKKERFEIAVILEGIVESTGMTTQARSSYLVNEILWGHRFEKLITFQKEDGTYKIDYSRFNMTVPIDTPTCSARELAELKEQEKYYPETLNDSIPSTINSRDIINETYNINDIRKRKIGSREENTEGYNFNNGNAQKSIKEIAYKEAEVENVYKTENAEPTLVNSSTIPAIVIAEKNFDDLSISKYSIGNKNENYLTIV